MLNKIDFKSIWEVAHHWEEIEPPDNDPPALNEGVSDKIQKIIWAFRDEILPLRHPSGYKATEKSQSLFDLLFLDRTLIRLNRCLKKQHFPRSLLDQLFVKRNELLRWCDRDWIEPPSFWDDREKLLKPSDSQAAPFGKHYTEIIDKNRCQAIAHALWELDPSIHPAHMAKSKAMRVYGNGGDYKGKDGDYETVKKWIREADPCLGERKEGKPPNIKYLINLETHRLDLDQICNTR